MADDYKMTIPEGYDRAEFIRNRVFIERDRVTNVSSSDFPHTWDGYDDSWSLEKFKKKFKVKIYRCSKESMEFDFVGIDASIANAFRRIMISEVPTMAIENLFVLNNTSIVQDEVLAHRLGLVPIQADPTKFQLKGQEDAATDMNTIVFRLKIRCDKNPKAPENAVLPTEKYINSNVYSSHLIWIPQGDQAERFKDQPIRPVHDDILIAKLRPGQEIEAEMHCHKGIGKDHAKFSPVATATYRLLPSIIIKNPIQGELAHKFQSCFAPGVISIEKDRDGVPTAVVTNPRKDTVSREVLRHKEFQDNVVLTRIRDHFIFSVEPVGQISAPSIVVQSIKELMRKCKVLKTTLSKMNSDDMDTS
ncbi:DNA-directed RNA polymerase [Paraphysoderma sedebokerense]|nr:DNA-directed RNA polymerase [Paraphysoderma sedebokerense]